MLDSPLQKSSGFSNLPLTLKDKIKDIIDFVFTDVCREADIYIAGELVRLRYASLHVEAARADESIDEGWVVEKFICRMAFCIVIAFFQTWGAADL